VTNHTATLAWDPVEALSTERDDILEQLASLDRTRAEWVEFDHWDDNGKEPSGEAAVAWTERSAAERVRAQLRARLDDVEDALRRVTTSRYGACIDCHQAIAPERLEALPAAARCVSCQARNGSMA
jgi:DnaK suppressor protein